jgi:hypothetical protein
MPITPAILFEQIGLSIDGTVDRGDLPNTDSPGVYAISLCRDPRCNDGLLPRAPIDVDKVKAWIKRVPTFCFRGHTSPKPRTVTDFLAQFWFCDESIVYIGKAKCLHKRLQNFRSHTLGNRSPHAGGHWVKTLSNLDRLFIHFCICQTVQVAEAKEDAALKLFKSQISPRRRRGIQNLIPFANRAHPHGSNKQDEIFNDVLPRHVESRVGTVTCE